MTMHINQHVELGNCIKETRKYLAQCLALIPANSTALRKATQSLLVIDELSFAMEEQLNREVYYARDPRNFIPGVYRGDELYKYKWNHKGDPQDEDLFQYWYKDEL
jgi:hypothetical protein